MSVVLFLEENEADVLLALAGKGIGVFAQRVDTASAVEDIAELARAGVAYSKLSAEITRTRETAAESGGGER
jgi:hypothetical protein